MITHLDDIIHPLRVLGKVGSGAYSVAVTFASADPTFYFLSCIDNITIESRKNGAIVREQYGNLNRVSVSVQADANTPVKIIGDVTEIGVSGDVLTDIDVTNCGNLTALMAQFSTFEHIDLTQNEHLQYLDLLYNSALEELDVTNNPELLYLALATNTNITSLDLSHNPALQALGLNTMPNITDLDLSANTALDGLALIDCTGITTLDLSHNPALTSFNGSGSVNIDTIYVYSDNASVATGIANLITNATANDGTVYTNTAGANFSTIKTAALAKGWTIRQLGSWLTDTTQQAILTAFGDTDGASVIAATDD